MKCVRNLLLVCVVALLLGNASQPVHLLTDERPPYEYLDESGVIVGIVADRIACALDYIGVPYKFSQVPWERAQEETRKGRADGFFSASKNSRRDKYATLSSVIVEQYWNWYFVKGRLVVSEDERFKKNIGVASWAGSNSLKWLKRNGHNVVAAPLTPGHLVKMLLSGRVDAIFGSNHGIENELRKLSAMHRVQVTHGPYRPMGVYFSKRFLKAKRDFLKKFNMAVTRCRQ